MSGIICGNCHCFDKSKCELKKDKAVELLEVESNAEVIVVDAPAGAEHNGDCKCGSSCACNDCSCGN